MTEFGASLALMMASVQDEFERISGMTMVQVPVDLARALEAAGLLARNESGVLVLGARSEDAA